MAINKLILLGGHIQALGLARQACICDVPVYVCLKDAYSVARYSNSVKEFFIIDNDDKLEDKILSLADKNTLLFPTSDDYIDFIVERYDNLSTKMQIGLPSLDIINTFNNKRNAYEYIK